MKKVLKPAQEEDSVYYSDFNGTLLGSHEINVPPCEVTISFNYGSSYDGENITLHLSDEEALLLREFLKTQLNSETKNNFKNSSFLNFQEGGEKGD
jgi:hypothetical protein